MIAKLHKLGQEPDIEILKYGRTERDALLIESSANGILGVEQLANRVRGHHAGDCGRGRLEDIIQELGVADVQISLAAIFINISRLYRYGMSPLELHNATRGVWKVGPRRANAEYVFSIYGSIIRAVYVIAAWVPSGSTMTNMFRVHCPGDARLVNDPSAGTGLQSPVRCRHSSAGHPAGSCWQGL